MNLPDAVVLVIPTLVGGGAERVMCNMARWWAEQGTKLTLISFSESPTAYALHPAVQRLFIDAIEVHKHSALPEWPTEADNVGRLRVLFEQTPARAPIISFLTRMNLRTILAAQAMERRVIVCERVWPPSCVLDATTESLRQLLYPQADCVVVQTQRCMQEWAAKFIASDRIAAIPNAIASFFSQPYLSATKAIVPEYFLLASGRLEKQKNFVGLIDIFALLASTFTHLHLVILGEGPMRAELEACSAAYGLSARVVMPGFVRDCTPYYQHAHAFVLTSFFEGFPNSLLEAMAHGCPALAFDCATGPAEIIRHGVDGLLVPPGDSTALCTALVSVLRNHEYRNSLALRAQEVQTRFAEDAIMRQWNRILMQ